MNLSPLQTLLNHRLHHPLLGFHCFLESRVFQNCSFVAMCSNFYIALETIIKCFVQILQLFQLLTNSQTNQDCFLVYQNLAIGQNLRVSSSLHSYHRHFFHLPIFLTFVQILMYHSQHHHSNFKLLCCQTHFGSPYKKIGVWTLIVVPERFKSFFLLQLYCQHF